MLKWLFWLILVLVFWGIARSRAQIRSRSSASRPASKRGSSRSERMVPCALCRLHVPEDEAVFQDGKTFCGEHHYRQWKQTA